MFLVRWNLEYATSLVSVLVCSGCCSKMPQAERLIKSRNLLLTVLEPEVHNEGANMVGRGPLSVSQTPRCVLMWLRGTRALRHL